MDIIEQGAGNSAALDNSAGFISLENGSRRGDLSTSNHWEVLGTVLL